MSSLLTNSRAKLARLCPRKEQLQYQLGYRPTEVAEELDFGTLIHAALEAWWCHALPGIDPELRLVAAAAALDAGTTDPYVKARALVMVQGYHARWVGEALEAVAVEAPFRCALINPDTGAESRVWELAGKLDVVARDAGGELWLVEHKTSSEDLSPGGTYHRRLRMDSQVSIYFDGAASLGHVVRGCVYDVLSKPTQRPLKATPPEKRKLTKEGKLYAGQREADETPDEYQARLAEAVLADPSAFYARIEVPRLEAELLEAQRDLWQLAQRLREDVRLKRAPRNPDACTAYGRVCPFFDVCTGMASLADPARFTRLTDVHPELAGMDATTTPADPKEEGSPCPPSNP